MAITKSGGINMTEHQHINQARPPKQYSAALRVLAMVASYVFHPVFMPAVMTVALFHLAPVSFAGYTPKAFFAILLLPVIVNTLFFPLIGVLLCKGVGFIESIHLKTTKDRIIPLLISMIFYFWAFHVFRNTTDFYVPHILQVLLLGSFWGVITVFMINIFVKVSMHTAAAGSMLGILLILMFTSPVNMVLPFFLALIIAGIIGTARMILQAHYKAEIWLGYLAGILVQLCAYWYL